MMLQSTLSYLDALYRNVDPVTGNTLTTDSVFTSDSVRYALANLQSALQQAARDTETISLTDDALQALCENLQELEYDITPTLLVHICRGSRRVVDSQLRGMAAFGRYRGLYSKAAISRLIQDFSGRHPEYFIATSLVKKQPKKMPWKKERFFDENAFDKLESQQAEALKQEVNALPFSRPDESLPAFKLAARKNYPRAYEPWTKNERALLLEAMCYTNQLVKLAPVFGRSENSIKLEGQRLIWKSRQGK